MVQLEAGKASRDCGVSRRTFAHIVMRASSMRGKARSARDANFIDEF
jgi:predicted DNA-binding protein (UPF0251 family)